MRMAVTVIVLAVWFVAGPVGMAFSECAMMGAMCEAPCGMLSSIVTPTVTAFSGLEPLTYLNGHPPAQIFPAAISPLDPPPKSALLSA